MIQNSEALFFILSKLLYFLIDPVTWVLLGFISWLLFRKWKRRKTLGRSLLIFLIIFSNSYLYKAIVLAWQPLVASELPSAHYQTAVLLSGMTYLNQKKEAFFGTNSGRFIQTALLYHTGHAERIIVSGGDGTIAQERPKEALFLKQKLVELNIPSESIVSEPLSRNTYESAIACKKIIDSLQIRSPVWLITSAMHMKRAKACFEKQGIAVVPLPCNYAAVDNPLSFSSILIPELGVLTQWKFAFKEMVGLLMYRISGKA